MDFITDDQLMTQAINRWLYGPGLTLALAPDKYAALESAAATGGPGDKICNVAELLYAHYDLLDDAAKTIMAQCFALISRNGWTSFNRDNRCAKIVGMVMEAKGMVTPIQFIAETPPEPLPLLREDDVDWRVEVGLIEAPEDTAVLMTGAGEIVTETQVVAEPSTPPTK